MLVTQGGRFGGYGFYILKGKPVFLWNLVDLKRIRWESPEALTPGKHTLEFDFKYDGLGMGTLVFGSPSGIGRGGTGVLKVDGKAVPRKRWKTAFPSSYSGMKISMWVPTRVRLWTIRTTRCRSNSTASSSSSLSPSTGRS